jgi:hypothetical protein
MLIEITIEGETCIKRKQRITVEHLQFALWNKFNITGAKNHTNNKRENKDVHGWRKQVNLQFLSYIAGDVYSLYFLFGKTELTRQ